MCHCFSFFFLSFAGFYGIVWAITADPDGKHFDIVFPGIFALFAGIGFSIAAGVQIYGYWEDRRDRRRARSGSSSGFATWGGISGPSRISGDAGTFAPDTRVVEEPIRGWKMAKVITGPDGPTFAGIGANALYAAEAVAECAVGGNHQCPDPGCSCGFYARKERHDVSEPAGDYVLLEVELYGRVMVGSDGYRAEKQRVLAVYADRSFGAPRCSCQVDNTGMSLRFNGAYQNCSNRVLFSSVRQGRPLCAEHALEAMARGSRCREYENALTEVPNLGTEWRWVE